jgi:hypothetical protein
MITPYTIDNFLPEEDFKKIVNAVSGPDIDWHYSYSVADGSQEEDDMYFIHLLYMGLAEQPKDGVMPPPPKGSDYYHLFEPLFKKLPEFNVLIRAKLNLYGRTHKIIQHEDHIDMDMKHRGVVFSLNTCNGGTVIDGKKFESVANRILFFDSSKPHHSTSTTDVKRRLNVNINYL